MAKAKTKKKPTPREACEMMALAWADYQADDNIVSPHEHRGIDLALDAIFDAVWTKALKKRSDREIAKRENS